MNNVSLTDTNSCDDDVVTLAQMARLLNVSEKTLLRMADHGAVPGFKVSGQWRFQKAVLDNLLYNTMSCAENDTLVEIVQTRKNQINSVPKLVSSERIVLGIKTGNKKSVLKPMVDCLGNTGVVSNPDSFCEELLEREEISSTALGGGFAIPHQLQHDNTGVKHPALVIGIAPQGVDFDSLDGKPTYLFALICAPTTTSYLRLLAKVLVMLRIPGILEDFKNAQSSKEIMDILFHAHVDLSIRF